MKSQISRDAFQPEQRYSGVYLQQGRMILDADWNELTDIQKAALVAALRDAVSGTLAGGGAIPGGAPRVGGLGLVAVPPDSTSIRIQPGALYVEGMPARLDAAAPVEVAKQPDYPIDADYPPQSLRLYADVWERAVTALNGTAPDPADPDKKLKPSALMDAALHGADTASRSQTLVQVKWCADTLDPLDPAVNPAIGDALLSLKLNLISSGGDKCDPCASQVKADERIGNYLFRVEVHDYDRTGRWLTLKWSRDNGAEACAVAAMPNGFGQGEWLWEYFDDATERLLGNHFASNPKKLRGLIKATCSTPNGADEPKDYVRQWDGAIRVNLGTGNLAPAAGFPSQDRGVLLDKGLPAQAPGRVEFTAGVLKINLEHLELSLATQGHAFVPGDYWLAPVREAKDASGATVLDAQPPRGVRHHYLYLGAIGINKKLVAQDDAFRRRMAFPPLTDLTARDVGFSDHCAGLYAGAKNVQEALDNLCAIDASDIAYPLPGCGGNTVRERLKPHLDPDGDNKLTVKIALDTLLCQLNAGTLPYTVPDCGPLSVRAGLGLAAGPSSLAPVIHKLLCELTAADLPIDKTDNTLCSDLQSADVATVQDALRVLCLKSGGCAVTVTSANHLVLLLKEFAQAKEAQDLWLCLKAGTYSLLDDQGAITGKRSLRLSGEGPESVQITFGGAELAIDADEVILENLALTFTKGSGQLAIKAAQTRTTGCRIARTSSAADGPAMISVAGRNGSACRLHWRDNSLYAQVKTSSFDDVHETEDIKYQSDWALRLETAKVGGVIAGNVIDGWLLLGNGVDDYHNPDQGVVGATLLPGPTVVGSGLELRVEHNTLAALKANLTAGSVDHRRLTTLASGYTCVFLVNNSLAETGNTVVADNFVGQGNIWYRKYKAIPIDVGSVIANRATFTGNLVECPLSLDQTYGLTSTVQKHRLASAVNVTIDLLPAS